MQLTIHQVRCFLAVVRSGTFRGAAEQLHLSTSSVSEQIAQLEATLGRQLLERTSQGTRPTAAGHELLPLAEQAATAMDAITRWATGPQEERVRIGLMVSTPRISDLVAQAARETPAIGWEVRHLGFVDWTAALLEGSVDCAVVVDIGLAPDLELVAFPLWQEGRVLVTSATHRLAERPTVTMADLAGETLIGVDGADAGDRWLDGLAVRSGSTVTPDDRARPHPITVLPVARTFEEVLDMCEAGLGVNIAGVSARDHYARPGLRFIALEDALPATYYLCVRPGPRSPGLERFIGLARRSATVPGTS